MPYASKERKRLYDAARQVRLRPELRAARAKAQANIAGAVARISEKEKNRFWKFVAAPRRAGDCWLWIDVKHRQGYGQFRSAALASSGVLAHRYSWLIHYGPVPDELDVCHRCDVPGCVNPHHLFLGTHTDNMRDMFAKGRRRILRGAQHPGAILTEEDVREIRRKRATGVSLDEQSKEFGLAKTNICAIARRRSWKHVEERRTEMLAVYLGHPLSAPTREGMDENRLRAAQWAKWLWQQGFSVECSWIVATGVLDETPENRALGLRSDCEQVKRCDVMVLCGPRISGGMLTEAAVAKVIVDFTYIGLLLPNETLRWRHGRPITLTEIEERMALQQEHAEHLAGHPTSA